MIIVELENITEAKTEAIVSASNGVGIMGAGVAGAIRHAAGFEVQEEARYICKNNKTIAEGSFFVTKSGALEKIGIKKIYHAVTMKYPGGLTSLDIIRTVLPKVLEAAIRDGMKSIAIPGLGTGIGGLNKSQVAAIIMRISENYHDKIEIHIVDRNKEFIDYAKNNVRLE
jgi:O-acetyl-ADP-ribose deacetylase (regulator of RNase III)